MHRRETGRLIAGLLLLALTGLFSTVKTAAGDDAAGAQIGAPVQVTVSPENPPLSGKRATRQLIVTGKYADGSLRDLTRLLSWTSLDPQVAVVSERGQVIPKSNGTATIVARRGSIEAMAKLKVERMNDPAPVSFRRDVIPAFSQAGCNTGACHGTPTGKGGFRLSLRGYLPEQDFLTLSRETGGRRINLLAADTSLLLAQTTW